MSIKTKPTIHEGEWLALGLRDGRCPVGAVTAVNGHGVTVQLKSWMTGGLMDERLTATWDEISLVQKALDWTAGPDGERIYDDRHLGAFQTWWREEVGDR